VNGIHLATVTAEMQDQENRSMSIEPTSDPSFDVEVTAAVETALVEVLGRHGAMLEAFTGMANFISSEGDRQFVMFTPDDQLHVTTLSLTAFMDAWNIEVRRLAIHDMLNELDPDE
jgi:hypothetical protein